MYNIITRRCYTEKKSQIDHFNTYFLIYVVAKKHRKFKSFLPRALLALASSIEIDFETDVDLSKLQSASLRIFLKIAPVGIDFTN